MYGAGRKDVAGFKGRADEAEAQASLVASGKQALRYGMTEFHAHILKALHLP